MCSQENTLERVALIYSSFGISGRFLTSWETRAPRPSFSWWRFSRACHGGIVDQDRNHRHTLVTQDEGNFLRMHIIGQTDPRPLLLIGNGQPRSSNHQRTTEHCFQCAQKLITPISRAKRILVEEDLIGSKLLAQVIA